MLVKAVALPHPGARFPDCFPSNRKGLLGKGESALSSRLGWGRWLGRSWVYMSCLTVHLPLYGPAQLVFAVRGFRWCKEPETGMAGPCAMAGFSPQESPPPPPADWLFRKNPGVAFSEQGKVVVYSAF